MARIILPQEQIMSFLMFIYNHSPVLFQNLGINAYGWHWKRIRLGRVFEEEHPRWCEREEWPADRFKDYLAVKLREALKTAYERTEYYPARWSEYGITRERIDRFTPSDLGILPVTVKQDFRARPGNNWKDGEKSRDRVLVRRTSGSTGTPLEVAFGKRVLQEIYAAVEARSYRWAGVSLRESRSMIGARPIIPVSQKNPPFWRYNHFERQVYLSAFHIAPANIPDYYRALNRFKPVFMTGFASANFFLARMFDEAALCPHSPRAVVTSSEKLYPEMKETLERVYRTKVYESYGMVENCAMATTCEYGRLHVSPDFGIVEILREDGTQAGVGEVGRVVATGLVNTSSLFIRYDTGDLAAWSTESCPCSRSNLPVLKDIVGRLEDLVIGPDGRETIRFDRTFLEFPGIKQAQVIQEAVDNLRLKLVTTPEYDPGAEKEIRKRFQAIMGEGMSLSIEKVDRIPLDPSGKFRAVISKVKRERLGERK